MFNTSSNNNIPTFIHPYVTHSDTLSNVLFTEEIILNEVNNLPANSAPGPDGLTSKTIVMLPKFDWPSMQNLSNIVNKWQIAHTMA
jgi:hypothetical protein